MGYRMISGIDAVFFDLDGTLTDSGPGIMKAAALTLRDLGISVADESILRVFVGPPLSRTFLKFNVPESRVDEAIEIYRRYYHQGGLKFENSPYPGIKELLRNLRTAGKRLYVATSKPEKTSIEILQRFGMDCFFEEIAGATFDHTRENKQDVLRYLMEKTGPDIRPVMVGDTIYDVLGAAGLDLPCIGITWGYGDEEEMREAGAAAIAHSMEELYAMLTGTKGRSQCHLDNYPVSRLSEYVPAVVCFQEDGEDCDEAYHAGHYQIEG